MPIEVNGEELIIEKNKLNQGAWIWLVEVVMSPTEVIRVCANSDNVTFLSLTWTALPMRISNLNESNSGELPSFSIFCYDVSGILSDEVRKNNDLGDKRVTILKVPYNLVSTPTDSNSRKNYLTWQAFIATTTYRKLGVQFEVTSRSIMSVSGPRGQITRGSCQYIFKDPKSCQYVGPEIRCDKSLDGPQGCLHYDNVINYGGFPGVPKNV